MDLIELFGFCLESDKETLYQTISETKELLKDHIIFFK